MQRWKKSRKKIDGFRKKLKIPESNISENEENNLESEIGTIFGNDKIHLLTSL